MNLRSPESQAAYEVFKRTYTGLCPFCDVKTRAPEVVVKATKTMMITRNEYPYSNWDKKPVTEHLMLIPIREILSFVDFSPEETTDYWQLMSTYESNGYSVYTRAQQNTTRTIGHLHTHLFKLADPA